MHRLFFLAARRPIVLSILIIACGSGASPSNTVRFSINMAGPIAEGWFDAASDSVGIRGGTRPLSWSGSVMLVDPDGDGIYEGSVQFPPETDPAVAYKVKVEGSDNPNDGWESGGNRAFDRSKEAVVRRAYNDSTEALEASYTGDIRLHQGVGTGKYVPARSLIVYVPPGYDDQVDRRYPVLYMHDGQNLFDQRIAGSEWKFDESAEALIRAGEIDPVIIVGVYNGVDRTGEYTPTTNTSRYVLDRSGDADGGNPMVGRYTPRGAPGDAVLVIRETSGRLEAIMPTETEAIELAPVEDGFLAGNTGFTLRHDSTAGGKVQRLIATRVDKGGDGRAYADFLVKEVKPFIDENYRTKSNFRGTSVGGSSLGGLITMSIATWYPDVFSGYLVVSPSVWWNDEVVVDMVRESREAKGRKVWLDMGTQEGPGAVDSAARLRDALVSKGWTVGRDLMYVIDEGAEHNESAWAERGPDMLRFLYGR